MFNKLILYLQTIRFLKISQIFFRIKRSLFKKNIICKKAYFQINKSNLWTSHTLYPERITENFSSFFLNRRIQLDFPDAWFDVSDRLWNYNLHYFDDLNSDNYQHKRRFHLTLLKLWQDHNNLDSPGWEPYPCSLRVVNIIKAFLSGLDITQETKDSVHNQAFFLYRNLEKDILANHYFSNLKALLFYSTVFGDRKLFEFSVKNITYQLDEQVLEDGGNFERTPMYHSLFLSDLLDIYNLIVSYKPLFNSVFKQLIEKKIIAMHIFLRFLTHPNGEIAHFNDSVNGVSPKLDRLESYMKSLGIALSECPKNPVIDLKNSEFFIGQTENCKIIFDSGSISPSYQPGHAHAGTNSFELSYKKNLIFVNSGISEYGETPRRLFQRSTSAHNTVEVNGKNSSNVWSSFRVGKRAKVIKRSFGYTQSKRQYYFSSEHDGYETIFNKIRHKRTISFNDDFVCLEDYVLGRFSNITSRFYLHPEVNVEKVDNLFYLDSGGNTIICDFGNCNTSLVESTYFHGFGLQKPNKCILINSRTRHLKHKFYFEKI